MPKLTKRDVDAATPASDGRHLFLWDSEIKGFGLRVTSGSKSYVLQYRSPNGRKRRHTIGRHGSPWTADTARKEASRLLREISLGNDPLDAKAEARTAVTVAELVDIYLAEGPAERPNKKASSWKVDRAADRQEAGQIREAGRRCPHAG